ncbi:MAG: LamG domain-containing protein [Rhodoglobus sp.]
MPDPQPPARSRRRVLLSAVVILCGIALAVPSTSGAYIVSIANSTNTSRTAVNFTCASAVATDKALAYFAYALNQASGSTVAVDSSNNAVNGAYLGSMTSSTAAPIACKRDTGGAYVLNGSTSFVRTTTLITNPQVFSVEVWFKTTVASGKLIGFGNSLAGLSTRYDRHLYINTAGKITFGTYNGATQTVTSPASYNDGLWHHAVGTSSSAGMVLYIDGVAVASNPAFTVSENYSGYWRVGYDNLNGWPAIGANRFFTGSMRFAAAYSVALTPAQVQRHYIAGT